jgi:hypothetical protein
MKANLNYYFIQTILKFDLLQKLYKYEQLGVFLKSFLHICLIFLFQ